MKFDKRIIEGKKPLTCFDTEQAKEFLGKECYFSNCKVHYKNLSAFEKFESLTDYCIGTLTAIMDLGDRVFDVDQQCKEFRYCLPCEWVKPEEPEKKYRPFSIEEWKFKHSIGNTILYRYKGTYCGDHCEAEVMYLGYIKPLDGITDETGKGQIVLGNNAHGLQNLFDNYEMWVDGKWQPFGVIEEQE